MRSSLARRFVSAWLTLVLACIVAASQSASAQSLTTDREDYQPGETAVLTGSGFAPNEMVTMLVMHIDGSASLGVAHDPWFVDADANGDFMALWECLEDCRGATLLATADQASGAHAEVEYTDALGIGRVSNVTPLDGGCVSTDITCTSCGITSGTGTVQSWYVQQGKTYAVTLSCVTNCAAGGTAPTIDIIVTNPGADSPSTQCLTATQVATGVYTFSITMPDVSCYSFPILYCTSGCSTTTGFNARRCDGRNFQAQLKAGHFTAGCVHFPEPNFADECCSSPTLIGVPSDVVVECNAIPVAPTVFGSQSCTQCSVVNVSFSETSNQGAFGTCAFSTYTIARTWTVTDGCGQEVSSTQVIRVRDTTPPTLAGQGPNLTLQCPASPNFTAPTASDNCNSASVVLVSDITTPGCGGSYSEKKTWKAIDACGNESGTVSQTINIVDTTPPTIGLPGPNQNLECPASPNFTAPTAGDTCGVATVVLVSDVTTPGCGGSYSEKKTWKAIDACGNESGTVSQTINVLDTTPPIIGSPGPNATLECPATPNFTAPTASDVCSSASVVLVSDISTPGCGGTYSETKIWKAVDACGNESDTVSQTINLVDTTPPVIGAAGPHMTIDCASSPHFTVPTVTDQCSFSFAQQVSDVTTFGCGASYSETKIWKAVDTCGNESGTVSQTIDVVDSTAPTLISCAPDLVLNGDGNPCLVITNLGRPVGVDNCGPAVYQSTPREGECFPLGDTSVTWFIRDGCGNFVTCTQNVRVLGVLDIVHYYDANANGLRDIGEIGIPGWKVALSDGQTGFTDASGVARFNVAPGVYDVQEPPMLEPNWVATTPTTGQVTVSGASAHPTWSIGNYCYSPPSNGFSQSVWSTPTGVATLQANDPAWRYELNALNLRTANGGPLYLSPARTFTEASRALSSWLAAANSTNMAYMLSAQLAVAKLDALYMGLNESTAIVVPGGAKTTSDVCIVSFLSTTQNIACGWPPVLTLSSLPGSTVCGCSANNGVVTIGDLLARADCLLGSYGNVIAPSTQRTYQDCVSVLLDMIVNNGNNGYACGGLSQYINGPGNLCPTTFP